MLFLCVLIACLPLSYSNTLQSAPTSNYDMIIFSQIWPQTDCYEWEEKSSSHKCNLPSNEEWSIHGVWPNKNKTLGPFYCNKTAHFDLNSLTSILPQLQIKWIDVHKGAKPNEFWRHEWEKHGTCAIDLEIMNTEKKYFQKGLDLFDEYDMKHVLAKANVVPYEKYYLQDYLNAVQKILGKNAYVECVKNDKRNEIYLSEIRICFSKQFELINCDGVSGFPSNCNHKKPIIYPGSVPDLISQPYVIQI